MTLQSYLKKHQISQEAFAKSLGVSKGLVWQWLNGRTEITGRWAVEIERVTQGEIKRQQIRPELYRGMAA